MIGEVDAVTFDFFETLAHHRTGGRGGELVAYLRRHRFSHRPWAHRILYTVFEPPLGAYPCLGSDDVKRSYRVRLAARVFEAMEVSANDGVAEAHADGLWEVLGPSALAVFPEVPDVLRGLRDAGFPLAIVSNWQHGLGSFVYELGLGEYIDHVVVSAEVGSEKPDGKIFSEASRLLEVEAGSILHVGDNPVDDWEGARAAGLQAVVVARGGESHGPEVQVVADLREVQRLVGVG